LQRPTASSWPLTAVRRSTRPTSPARTQRLHPQGLPCWQLCRRYLRLRLLARTERRRAYGDPRWPGRQRRPSTKRDGGAHKGLLRDLLEQHFAAGNDERPPQAATSSASWSEDTRPSARVYDVTLPTGGIMCVTPDGVGAGWRGQTDVLARVLFGLDLALLTCTERQAGSTQSQGHRFSSTTLRLVPADAVHCPLRWHEPAGRGRLRFLRNTHTIDVQRLTYGIAGKPGSWPGVGGPIEIAQ